MEDISDTHLFQLSVHTNRIQLLFHALQGLGTGPLTPSTLAALRDSMSAATRFAWSQDRLHLHRNLVLRCHVAYLEALVATSTW